MKLMVRFVLVALLGVTICAAEPAVSEKGMVATGHPLATRAAVQVLEDGGNAVDAAVAAGLMLGVVDGSNSGIGGGCFILIRTAKGEVIAIDGRETAPAKATPDMFLRDGKADTQLSQVGALASGTPGALAAYAMAAERWGNLPMKRHLLTAAVVAEEGFEISGSYASRLKSEKDDLARFESSREIFLNPDGEPWEKGHVLVQVDLARTYREIAEKGSEWFYNGAFAEKTGAWMAENGGVLIAGDFREYQPVLREAIRATYRGREIITFPPPSSGGVHLVQMLNMLEQWDVAKLGAGSADFIHVTAEAMKLAFADRAHWLGDPDFAPVPRGLLSKDYAKELAARIDMAKAATVEGHGTPPNASEDVFRKHTTHFSVADAEGNWVACTATINTTFGSKVVVPGTGVLLNNEMDDFALQPGVPNAFKLVGAEANAVRPGKRPLSSMTPTIVVENGMPVLSVGAAGGPTIISQTLLAIVNTIDFKMDVAAALGAPRFHHQWRPEELRIERAVDEAVRAELEKRGHALNVIKQMGVSQAVSWNAEAKRFEGAADPRANGEAAGP